MKKLAILLLCFGCFFPAFSSRAIDLKQSKITQVVNNVEIITAHRTEKAVVNDIFSMPDILRTGAASRAELVASDQTVTRVGANTIFSFDPARRTIDLKQGSLLFHSPHGKGGGTIQTGSATASVLGTTLIVTTTPSGGFKVIDLEGSVEVKFLNGLQQKLAPGQMTFVLPGGNQLAPIIVFRLDDLTKNSLLVKGFSDQLSSMPLIQQQIEKQLKLIKSGKLSDTGLEVGNDANAHRVKVLDLNTLQAALDHSYRNPNGVAAALGADATIDQPSLSSSQIPTPPNRIFTTRPFTLPGNNYFAGQPFTGFAGRNIYINTPGALEGTLTVDMSPYANLTEFDMVAAHNLDIEGPVTFSGFSSVNSLYFFLVAGNQITISPGATLTANVANLEMSAPGAFTLDNASILDNFGNLALTFGSDFTMQNGASLQAYGGAIVKTAGNISLTGSSVNANSLQLGPANGSLTLDSSTVNLSFFGVFRANNSINIRNSTINDNPWSGVVSFDSGSGSVSVSGTSISTHYLYLNSGDGILLDGSGQSFTASGSDSIAYFHAPYLITVNNADFSSFAELNMVANTISLTGDTLAPISNFGTHTGQVNVNGSLLPGGLNLINCTWQNTPVTSASQITLSSGPGNTPGIYSYANGN